MTSSGPDRSEHLSGGLLIGRVRIKDAAKWAAYRDALPATLVAWEGVLIARGRDAIVLTGMADETDTVVIRFPSLASIESWYASPGYRALIANRDEAADVTIVGYRIG